MNIKDKDLLSDTPMVAVDLDVMEDNIKWLASLAKEANVKLRPHTKTHKSPYIAQLQIDAGAHGITTATLGEAEVMVNAGIHDILIAFPIIGERKLNRFKKLHERADLIVSLDDIKVAEGLNEVGKKSGKKVSIYVDVDAGLKRMGKSPEESIQSIEAIAKLPHVSIKGVMSHTGLAYTENTDEGVAKIGAEEATILHETKVALQDKGIDIPEISVGASATARVIKDIPYITEVRAGMYVFNDRMVMGAGGATGSDCALTIFATVVSRPYKNHLIIDAGSKTLTSDTVKEGGHGLIKGHNNLVIERLSEEHGIVEIQGGETELQIGDVVEIIPNHVCPAINLADNLYGFREGELERLIQIEGRGMNR